MKRNFRNEATELTPRNYKELVFILLLSVVPLGALANPVAALQATDIQLDPVLIEIHLNSNGSSILTLEATCENVGASDVDEIPFRIESTDASVVFASEDASLDILERYSILTLTLSDSLATGEVTELNFGMLLNDIQSNVGSSFSGDIDYVDSIFYVRPLSIYRNFTLISYLPPQGTLSQESVSPIFPSASGNFTDGQSLAFVWQVDEIVPGQERVFIVRYQTSESSTVITGYDVLEVAIFTGSALFIGLLLGLFGPRIVDKLRQIGRVRFVGVTSEEEEVIEIIRNKGGSCSQKDLYSQLDMSQSKVSLVLTALEERGLVRRFKDGRENIVHLLEK